MSDKVKFRMVPQDEFDARYPEVNEYDPSGARLSGEVQIPGTPGWFAASIYRGIPDRYWKDDVWCSFEAGTQFARTK
ncbi:MAG: hypothetical protein FJY85_00265 [Deltaproteobacteria bacterium]|nr:hypothetical protein [Deltaproteobacteria bacterium]